MEKRRYMEEWWKKTVFYQIYIPSFCDGNGDGIGDFAGIKAKLSYLKELGVGGIWLTPFYPSPKVDQGYDISDYYGIDPTYGTMEEFEAFLDEAHRLGIRVISDIVINHTSTEHPWFLEARGSAASEKRNWYIWKKPKASAAQKLPNNWESFFGGSAWEYDETTGEYYYHSFAKEQADLNWAEPEVKKAVFQMLDFWAEKGIDGFRLDVINNLTLTDCMTDNPLDEEGSQIHRYDVNQAGIHEFMKELRQTLSQKRALFLVGEISSDRLAVIHSFVGDGGLDTTFNFNLGSMERFEFGTLYGELQKMTELYGQEKMPTIFFGSHDMARFPSRFHFDTAQVKNIFTLMMSYRAIPFIYFGDELGMCNYECRSISDARDIQGILAYRQAKDEGKTEEEALRILNEKSRDHGRNTMYWDDSANGGFSSAAPWIPCQKQPGESAARQMKDEASLYSYVARLTRIRTSEEALILGACTVDAPAEGVLVCTRAYQNTVIWAVVNFSAQVFVLDGAAGLPKGAELMIVSVPEAVWEEERKIMLGAKSSAMWKYIKEK